MSKIENPSTILELSLKCTDLTKRDALSESDPIIVIYAVPKDAKIRDADEIGRTEAIKDSKNPTFKLPIQIQYFFEREQKLEIVVYDVDEKKEIISRSKSECIGSLKTTLTAIVTAQSGKFKGKLVSPSDNTRVTGFIQIEFRDLKKKEKILIQFAAQKLDKKDIIGKSDPYLLIYRVNKTGEKSQVTKTETIKNTLSPVWKPIEIFMGRLVELEEDPLEQSIFIECFDWDVLTDHDLIGTATLTIRQCLTKGHEVPLINFKKLRKSNYKNSGTLQIQQSRIVQDVTFVDYLKSGFEISIGAAIDFTASNGHFNDPCSLHYINPSGAWNTYMQALFDVSDILLQYDADQEVPLYGFGAVLPGNTAVSHNFHVNFNPDNPQVKGSEGILDAYLRCLPQLRLSGPTCFAPILNEFCNVIQNFPKKKIYFVLLILTDGVICDLQATKDALVAASYLPLSIVIVGMGQSDFSAMQELDADVHPLVNGEGKKAIRDLVQFVPFHQFFKKQDNEAGRRLAAEVLHEIPTQFLKYMEQNNIQL